jgi:hypothetical protein
MGEIETRTAEQAGLNDDQLPIIPDLSLAFWKNNAKGLVGESIKAIEEAAKQIIGVTGILEGLYFHAIAYSRVRGKLDGRSLLIYIAPLCCWLVSLTLALLVFLPAHIRHEYQLGKREPFCFRTPGCLQTQYAQERRLLDGSGCVGTGRRAGEVSGWLGFPAWPKNPEVDCPR